MSISSHARLTAALSYAAQGKRVLPCEIGGKRPHGSLAPRGVKDATTDPARIREWWKRVPNANIGIATGDGWLVLDVDPRNGGAKSLRKLIDEHGPLRTRIVRTPSGGAHLYFRCDEPVRCSSPLPGIDIKGEGGYVLAPPSVLEAGNAYRAGNDLLEEAAPASLLSSVVKSYRVTAAPQEALQAPSVDKLREIVAHIPNDSNFESRDSYIEMAFAIRAAGADDPEAAFDIFAEWAARWTEGTNDPDTLQRDWEGLSGPYRIGWDYLVAKAEELGGYCSAQEEFEPLAEQRAEQPRAVFTSLAELQQNPEMLRPPVAVVPRIAWRGRLTILAAREKEGKSTLVAHAVTALSNGERFLGERTEGRRTIWNGFEEAPGDAVRRFTELRANGDNIQIVTAPGKDILNQTRALAQEWRTDGLIVFDSLQEYARLIGTPPKDGDNAGWSEVIRPLVALAHDLNVAVVVLHHVRKSDGEIRGATEIPAAADMTLTMRADKSDPTLRHISARGRWHVEPYQVALREGQYVIADGVELSLDAQVLLYLEDNPGASVSAVRRALQKRKGDVDTTIKRLRASGMIENRGHSGAARLYVVREASAQSEFAPDLSEVIDPTATEEVIG